MKVRPVSLWSCVHVPWEGRKERCYCKLWRLLRIEFRLAGHRLLGLRDRSAIPASAQGPVWHSATGHKGLPACEESSATSSSPQHRRRGALPASSARIHTPARCTTFHPQRPFLPIPVGWAACGVAPLVDRERRVGCSMDSSCELLRSLDPASVSVHCC
jgi:hypothetical protein